MFIKLPVDSDLAESSVEEALHIIGQEMPLGLDRQRSIICAQNDQFEDALRISGRFSCFAEPLPCGLMSAQRGLMVRCGAIIVWSTGS